MLAWALEGLVLSPYFITDFHCCGGGGCKHFVKSVTLFSRTSFSPNFSTGIQTKDAKWQRPIIQTMPEIV